jgi:hypothetical protein
MFAIPSRVGFASSYAINCHSSNQHLIFPLSQRVIVGFEKHMVWLEDALYSIKYGSLTVVACFPKDVLELNITILTSQHRRIPTSSDYRILPRNTMQSLKDITSS